MAQEWFTLAVEAETAEGGNGKGLIS